MPSMHNHRATPAIPSSSALLISLSHALDAPQSALGRRARRLAAHLALHPSDRALQCRAGDMLAVLLTETDCGVALDDEGLLDSGFDS